MRHSLHAEERDAVRLPERIISMVRPSAENSIREFVITFEDLCGKGKFMGPLPSGYAGFTWSDHAWFVTKNCSSSLCVSGQAALLNAGGEDLTVKSERLLDLKGLFVSSLWSETAEVLLEGWEKDVRKYATTLTVRRNTATWAEMGFGGIDRLEIKAGRTHVLIDDIAVLFR